jgi:cell division septum initiation protein DivIVA
VAEQQKSPFERVSNGYDPRQVAAFAAEALAWKRELSQTRSALDSAREKLDRYESVIGSVETVEREAAELIEDAERRAAEIIEQAEDQAAEILEMARDQVGQSTEQTSGDSPPQDGDLWLTPEPNEPETPDPVETIFEPVEEVEVLDPEAERERRVAAAAANLWKRRGVIAPSE